MSILTNGSSALLAFQRALTTIGHNVANAGTAGYSRQRVDLVARPGQPMPYGFVGAGVQVGGVSRVSDGFQFLRVLDSSSEFARLDMVASLSARMDDTLSGAGNGTQAAWSNFFDSMQGVVSQAASPAARQEMLAGANGLASRLRGMDAQFDAMGVEVENRLRAGMQDVNRLSGEIARLNQEIHRQRGLSGGQEPNDLLDQREQRIEQLSGLIGVTSVTQDDGSINVFAGSGQALVVGNRALSLTTVPDPFRPERSHLALQTPGGNVRLGADVGGQLGGLLEFRSDVLDAGAARLGRVAAGLAFSVNAQHRLGMDLNGDPGGDFFAPITTSARPASGNVGSGSITGTLADPAGFDGRDVILRYDGAAWSATDASSGQSVAVTGSGTPADPLRVGGMELTVGGAAGAGDRFLLQPAADAAGQMRVAITDPARIAAASLMAGSAAFGNAGSARVDGVSIQDPSQPGFGTPASVVFVTPGSYTLDGNGPFAYDPQAGIAGPGWTLRLDGTPAAGDTFAVGPAAAGSSDNANLRALAALDDLGVFEGGSVSLNSALGEAVVSVASQARQSGFARDAQQSIAQLAASDRDAVSGVNLDEEAANMLRFQQAYQAAAQVISTADSMFQSLLSAVRR